MSNLTLTWILVGVVVFIGTVMLVYNPEWGIYNGIIDNNGGAIDSTFANAYSNLTNDQLSITNLASDMSNTTNLWSVFTNTGLGVVNTLTLGITSIGFLIAVPGYINNINGTLETVSMIPSPFWWILETAVTIVGASLLIRALRGTLIEP